MSLSPRRRPVAPASVLRDPSCLRHGGSPRSIPGGRPPGPPDLGGPQAPWIVLRLGWAIRFGWGGRFGLTRESWFGWGGRFGLTRESWFGWGGRFGLTRESWFGWGG